MEKWIDRWTEECASKFMKERMIEQFNNIVIRVSLFVVLTDFSYPKT
jgi:hypothetical protein